jgi:phage terminase large subunit
MAIKPTITAKRLAKAIQDGYPVIIEEGGSSSGKTYGTVFVLILLAHDRNYRRQILGKNWPSLADKPLRISIVSDSLPHIKKGALRDFKANMNEMALWDINNWSATDFIYTFQDGSYIELFGLEDEGKAKGPRRDILYMNEANNNSLFVYNQLAMRTTGPAILDLNPSEFNCWVYDLADNPKNKRLHSTYLDNLENLSPAQIAFIESYKELPDDFLWKVYGLGQRGASKELIYTGWKLCSELPGKGDVFFGLDFGYTVATALVKVEHYEGSNYVQESIYLSGITTPELIQRMKEAGVTSELIYCDAAEPDRIDELIKAGFNAKKAVKDVVAGIVKVKSYPLYIAQSSKHLIEEMNGYKWATDNNGEVLADKPVKANDHAADAMRYAIMTHLNAPTLQYWAI